jgi:hypothetical protein
MATSNPGLAPSLDGAASGTNPLLTMPGGGGAPVGWADPNRWSSVGPAGPDLYHFAPHFPAMPDQILYAPTAADPMDFSPFGLEELLMAGMMESQI